MMAGAPQSKEIMTRQALRCRESNITAGAGAGGDGAGGHNPCVFGGKKASGKPPKAEQRKEDGAPLDASCVQANTCGGARGAEVSAAAVSGQSCRTFPLRHGDQPCVVAENVGKRQPRTEAAAKQKRTLIGKSRNVGQVQRKSTRQTESSLKTVTTKVNAVQPDKGHRKSKPTEMAVAMLSSKRCLVVLSPLEVSFPPTPATASTTNNSSGNMSIGTVGDGSIHSCVSTALFPSVPKDVVDIDARCDNLVPSTYTREVIQYWLQREPRHAMEDGFLLNSPEVTPRMRSVLMDWLIQVQDHEELQDETMHLCRVLIDRILARGGVIMAYLQLVGITCLLIASKFCERFCTEIKTLCYLTDNTYMEDHVIEYEKEVLVTLDWDITRPVCTHFLDRYLQVHRHPAEVCHLSMYLLDLSVISVELACVLPSKLAASALLLARRLLTPTFAAAGGGLHLEDAEGVRLPWTRALQFYSGYSEADLVREGEELEALLTKTPTSKFQGARRKYNTRGHCFISVDPRIDMTS